MTERIGRDERLGAWTTCMRRQRDRRRDLPPLDLRARREPGGLHVQPVPVVADEPLLFHTGHGRCSRCRRGGGDGDPARIAALDQLRPRGGRRVRGDEHVAGGAPAGRSCSARSAATSRSTTCRPAAAAAGGRRGPRPRRQADAPDRHAARAARLGGQVLFEETAGTLFCGDLLTHVGDGPAHHATTSSRRRCRPKRCSARWPRARTRRRSGARRDRAPTLALMHGSSFHGDGSTRSTTWPPPSSLPCDADRRTRSLERPERTGESQVSWHERGALRRAESRKSLPATPPFGKAGSMTAATSPATVDAYIDALDGDAKRFHDRVQGDHSGALPPGITEAISYKMPAFLPRGPLLRVLRVVEASTSGCIRSRCSTATSKPRSAHSEPPRTPSGSCTRTPSRRNSSVASSPRWFEERNRPTDHALSRSTCHPISTGSLGRRRKLWPCRLRIEHTLDILSMFGDLVDELMGLDDAEVTERFRELDCGGSSRKRSWQRLSP